MDLTQEQWDKISIESLDFILLESDKYLEETFKSFREVVNRCYFTIGIYFALLSYCFSKIIDSDYLLKVNSDVYLWIITGTFLGIICIFTTLMPKHMVYNGTFADYLLTPHFIDNEGDAQIREYKIQTILNSRNGCQTNTKKIDTVTSFFKISIVIVSIFIAISLIDYLLV